MAKPTSLIIASKIRDLEGALPKAIAAFQAAKDTLASAYAESSDTAAPAKQLSSARDNVEAIQAALTGLDEQYFAAASIEYSAQVEGLTAERDKKYQSAGGTIDEALKPAIKAIAAYLPDASAIVASILEGALQQIWVSLSEQFTQALLALGSAPAKAPPRY